MAVWPESENEMTIERDERCTEFIGVNVPSWLKDAANCAADKDRRSLADWVRLAMEAAIAAEGKRK